MTEPVTHSAKIRSGLQQARARGNVGGRHRADPQVGQYVVLARAAGRSWAAIADSLNQRMDSGDGPKPPQRAPRWRRSSLQSIHAVATRQAAT